jgi:hypothetical protein
MRDTARIHVDLETLGVRHTSQILSIGACHGTDTFYCEVDISTYNTEYFTQDQNTLDWWLNQGGFVPTQEVISPLRAINEFVVWFNDIRDQHEDVQVWANSPSFDCAILRHHFKTYALSCPWPFWCERDVRTVKSLIRDMRINIRERKNDHNALRDAQNQQQMVEAFYIELSHCLHTMKTLRLQGQIPNEEICVELHGADGV